MYCDRCGCANVSVQRVYGGGVRCRCERCGHAWHVESKGYDLRSLWHRLVHGEGA